MQGRAAMSPSDARLVSVGPESVLVSRVRFANQLPHCPKRRMRLCQFRMSEVDLNVIESAPHILDLSDGVPTLIPLFPAVAIR